MSSPNPTPQILAILGATGHQGLSLINHVLASPTLSAKYTIRALTRDPTSSKALALTARGISVVAADVLDASSLLAAFTGASALFAMTVPLIGPGAPEGQEAIDWEVANAKRIADAAVSAGIRFLVFSTLPSVRELSGGKYRAVTAFDAKAEAEKYIQSLAPALDAAFFCPANFMENFEEQPWLKPVPRASDGKFVLRRPHGVDTRMALIAAVEDCGKWVGAMLEAPEAFAGKRVCAAAGSWTWGEIAEALGKSAGKEVVYEQITYAEWRDMFPFAKGLFEDAYRFGEEFGGYYGEGGDEEVRKGLEVVKGEVLGLEAYLEKNPFTLE